MAGQSKRVETRVDEKSRATVKPNIVVGLSDELVGLAQIPGRPISAVTNKANEVQVVRLGDARWQIAQRQAIAAEIEREQGNQHLHRVISFFSGDKSSDPFWTAAPLKSGISFTPTPKVANNQLSSVKGRSLIQAQAAGNSRPQTVEDAPQKRRTADEIRRLFPGGIMLVLSIPDAFANMDEAMLAERNTFSRYAWEKTWQLVGEQQPEIIQGYWTRYRSVHPEIFGEYDEAEEQRLRDALTTQEQEQLTQMSQQIQQEAESDRTERLSLRERQQRAVQRRTQLRSLERQVRTARQARRLEAQSLRQQRQKLGRLPADHTLAKAGQRSLISSLLFETYNSEIKDNIWQNNHRSLANAELVNNRTFQLEARNFAQAHKAIAVENGQVVLGKHMTYTAPNEIAAHARAVHNAVLRLLQQYPSDASNDVPPEQVAKIRYLVLLTHGSPGWMGGHHGASGAEFRTPDVESIVSAMSDVLTPDIHLRLFACSTSADIKRTQVPGTGEGSIADRFRDELMEQHPETVVVGHTVSGRAVGNRYLRVFQGQNRSHTFILDAQNEGQMFSQEFLNAEIIRLELASENPSVKNSRTRKLINAMRNFYSAESWLFPSMRRADVSWETLGTDFRRIWSERVGPESPVVRSLRGIRRSRRDR